MMSNQWHKGIAAAAMILGLSAAGPSVATWSDDPTARTPVCTVDYTQNAVQLVAVDGGFVTSWNDQRRGSCGYNCTYSDVYAQRFSVYGEMLWAENGRVIAEGPAGGIEQLWQFNTGLTHDGNGDALIAWNDVYAPYSGYFQGFVTKATPDATVAWGNPGEPIQAPDTAVPMLANPVRGANPMSYDWGIAADSEGGLFVPIKGNPHTIARFSPDGRQRTDWYSAPGDFTRHPDLRLVTSVEPSDDDSVMVVWVRPGLLLPGDGNIVARKLVDTETTWPVELDTLTSAWGPEPVQIDDELAISAVCRLAAVPDGSGGVITVWMDDRIRPDTSYFRVYTQRVDADGNLLWLKDGVEVSGDVMTYTCYHWAKLAAAADTEGGVVIAWNDSENIRVQRLASNGVEQWSAGGIILDTGANANLRTQGLVRATDGNYIVLYHHMGEGKLITQKLDSALGTPQWGPGQVVFEGCFSTYYEYPARMVSDGRGGAVVAFAACDGNIYAHRVQALLLPELDIEKLTNGRQADGADDYDVPRIAIDDTVGWIYEILNTGEVAFPAADIRVTDSQTGVTPVLDVSSDDGDLILSPEETWTYTANAQALDLAVPAAGTTVVPGCNDGRNTYKNSGRVQVVNTAVSDEDTSHYCNRGDVDADGVTDSEDNCFLKPNGPLISDAGGNSQRDTDEDGYGNLCDPDMNNDSRIDFADLAELKSVFFSFESDADLDGNGKVDFADLAILKSMFFGPPGPSGLVP